MQAKEKLGFKAESYGLSETEASKIAYAFAVSAPHALFSLSAPFLPCVLLAGT
jgi:hypothetical protein